MPPRFPRRGHKPRLLFGFAIPVMRRLAVVQFFTWLGLFCLWIYFAPAVFAECYSPP